MHEYVRNHSVNEQSTELVRLAGSHVELSAHRDGRRNHIREKRPIYQKSRIMELLRAAVEHYSI